MLIVVQPFLCPVRFYLFLCPLSSAKHSTFALTETRCVKPFRQPLDCSDHRGTRTEMWRSLTLIDSAERFHLNFIRPAASTVRSGYENIFIFLTSCEQERRGVRRWSKDTFSCSFHSFSPSFCISFICKNDKTRIHDKRVSYDDKQFPVEAF